MLIDAVGFRAIFSVHDNEINLVVLAVTPESVAYVLAGGRAADIAQN